MKRAIKSYSAFDIRTAGESLDSSSSQRIYSSHGMKKSRRLTMEQTRVLEKSFELGKRLEAERKDELAATLGLHPRQIAIWFQNRRAKWKAKQLEEEFGVLKQDYESFKAHYQTLVEENKKLQAENQRLNSMFKNDQGLPDKEIMEDIQIDLNTIKEVKEECYSVTVSETNYPIQLQLHPYTEDHIAPQASMEETSCQNVLAKLEGNMVQDEHCYSNLSGFLWADHWTPTF
eukprot:PITA_35791